MINTKAIKNRIRSVGNTKKITKAMEMVSAAKMRKSIEAVLRTRTYASMARQFLKNLSKIEQMADYELLKIRPVKNLLVVLISSNRGLCGSFNSNVAKKTMEVLRNKEELAKHYVEGGKNILPDKEINARIIGVGTKSAAFAKKYGYNVVAVYDKLTESKSFNEVLSLGRMIMDEYKKAVYDKVVIVYTDYKTSLVQEARAVQLLPISPYDIEKMLADLGREESKEYSERKNDEFSIEKYVFEPSEEMIVKYVLPRLVEIQLYQAILESSASEHSARMMAMRNASDAAADMIDELNLTFNKARQAAITQEIAEIAGGAAALE